MGSPSEPEEEEEVEGGGGGQKEEERGRSWGRRSRNRGGRGGSRGERQMEGKILQNEEKIYHGLRDEVKTEREKVEIDQSMDD